MAQPSSYNGNGCSKQRPVPGGLYHEPKEKTLQCVLKRTSPSLYNEHFQGLTFQAKGQRATTLIACQRRGNEGTKGIFGGAPLARACRPKTLGSLTLPVPQVSLIRTGCCRSFALDCSLDTHNRQCHFARPRGRTTLRGRWRYWTSTGCPNGSLVGDLATEIAATLRSQNPSLLFGALPLAPEFFQF